MLLQEEAHRTPRPQFSSFNSAFSISDGEVIDRYDKVYLVPFGEVFPFIGPLEPLYTFIFAQLGLPLLSSRPPGDEITPLTLPSADAAVYICYESVFPHVTRQMVAQGAEVLVNISNDAWFGRGQGARQHFRDGQHAHHRDAALPLASGQRRYHGARQPTRAS